MKGKRNIFLRVWAVLTIVSFLMSGVSFGEPGLEVSNLAASANVFDGMENIPVTREAGQFRNQVREDMIRMSMAGFIATLLKPWEKGPDIKDVELKKRLAEFIGKSDDQEAFLKVQIDLDYVSIVGKAVFVPFSDMSMLVAKEQDFDPEVGKKEGWEEIGRADGLVFLVQGQRDLKGSLAGDTNPVIKSLIAEESVVEIYVDPSTERLKAARVMWVEGYLKGTELYKRQIEDLNQIFQPRELDNLEKWIKEHKVRGEYVKFRVGLGRSALGWKDDIERANISHAGVTDRVIYMGDMLLKKLMQDGEEKFRKKILDEDEYRHLLGLPHGTPEDEKARLKMVAEKLNGSNQKQLMLAAEDVWEIKKHLEFYIKSNDKENIFDAFFIWNAFCLGKYKYPVENSYPVKKAVALLDNNLKEKLINILIEGEHYQKYGILNLIDDILLMLEYYKVKDNWIDKHAPELKGRTLWQVSPEIWHEAGGLARVMQFHGVGMKELIGDADVDFMQVEPHYKFRVGVDGIPRIFDYTKDITHPFSKLDEVDRFTVNVGGKDVTAIVNVGVNDLGIKTFLIGDERGFYTHSLYNYKKPWEGGGTGLPSWEEFSSFYSKAALKFITKYENKMKRKKESEGKEWKPPLVHTNDSQTALFNIYAMIEKNKNIEENKDTPEKIDPVLKDMVIAFTTHTYINRGEYPVEEGGGDVLKFFGIPFKYNELLKHHKFGKYFYSMASGGLRTSDWQGTVGRSHRDDVAVYDEWVNIVREEYLRKIFDSFGAEINIVGVSNGDNLQKSRAVFSEIGNRLFKENFDPTSPAPEQILEIKKAAKENLFLENGMVRDETYYSSAQNDRFLDPSKPVISYSGRLVPEKAGRRRAFTDKNIETLVKEGAQILIYGNVQTKNEEGKMIRDELIALARRLREKNYKGRFIFVPRFTLNDQRALLAATDIQVQDSDVGFYHDSNGNKVLMGTEAAGYTESNVSACGGLQLAPPRPGNGEGLLKAQGLPLDFDSPGKGNTLIPRVKNPYDPDTWSPEAYLEVLLRTIEMGQEKMARYQATSARLSQILDARLTAAAYLRNFSRAVTYKKNKEKRRAKYLERKKREEENKTIFKQVAVPDPLEYPIENASYRITGKVLDRKVNDAMLLLLTHHASGTTGGLRSIMAGICNNLIDVYAEDGSLGNIMRDFLFLVRNDISEYTGNTDAGVRLSKDIQLICGQTETIFSWIDRHVPGAKGLRLTEKEKNMLTSGKGKSFIDKSLIPEHIKATEQEDFPGFYWRGTEGYSKIERRGYGRANIIEKAIDRSVPETSRGELEDKLVLYLMSHGFIEVPEKLRNITAKGGRITTMHETYFLHNTLPASRQMSSTGSGHFQSNGLDVKYVTEGKGVQVNVLYDKDNNIKEVIAHTVREGDWTISIPGYVDYMINCGGLRFNDISIKLDPEQEKELLSKFNPLWEDIKDAKISPGAAPVMGTRGEKRMILVRNTDIPEEIPVKYLPGDTFTKVMGRMMSLIDVYKYKLAETPENINRLISILAGALESGREKTERLSLKRENEGEIISGQKQKASFDKTGGITAYIEDNRCFFEEFFRDKTGGKKLIRIAVETLLSGKKYNAILTDLLKTLETTGKFTIQLYSSMEPDLPVGDSEYDKYGFTRPGKIEIARENVITILPIDSKSYEFSPSLNNVCWEKLGKTPEGEDVSPEDTIVMPVGMNYDKAGIARSVLLGLRISEIAEKNYSEEDPFVSYTLEQYRDFALSQGVSDDVFDLTAKDLINLAVYDDIQLFSDSLNRMIRALPIVPLDIEQIKEVYLCIQEVLIRA